MPAQILSVFSENLKPIAVTALRVAAILGGAFALNLLLRRALLGSWLYFIQNLQKEGRRSDPELEKQAATIAGVLKRTTTVLIYALATVMALRELGFDVAPLLAGAGVAGLAIGFGAQNLVRDVISGFFLLIENQIRVNDAVVINDTPGMVEAINLRTTVLRDGEGAVHVFPNGAIVKLANRTQGYSYYMFNLHLSYDDDPDRAIALLQETAAKLATEEPYRGYILAGLEVFGVDQLGETHVLVKSRIKTQPGKQWDVGREINRRMKLRLDEAGFSLPARGLRRVELMLPDGSPLSHDALRTAVREIVEEMRTLDDNLGPEQERS
jgi:moderate conductance mechanosensitive channel